MFIILTGSGDFTRIDKITPDIQCEFDAGFIDIINAKDFTMLTDDGWKEIPYETQDNSDS